MTPTNLDKLAEALGAKPVVTIADDDTVTVTVHADTAVYSASGPDVPAAAGKILRAVE